MRQIQSLTKQGNENPMSITSIVILTYNKLEYTKACIDSIRRYTAPGTYEIIVVDNLSTDGTREWLAVQSDIKSIFNENNVGFPKGCNQGIDVSSGDAILLLNNDVLVTCDWLKLMIDALYSSSTIGAVGPVTNSAYGYQEIPVAYKTLDDMWSFADSYNSDNKRLWERRLKLIGYCMLIKREAIDRVGLLDERFTPGMCEDSDYSFRLLEAGYELLLCRNIFIHHFGSTSFGEMKQGQKELLAKNRAKFEEKWGFHTAHSAEIRHDLIQLMDKRDRADALRVLDIGCACGATLLELSNLFPNAELHGIEKNKEAAAVAARFAKILVQDAEQLLAYSNGYFDVVILGNVLEQFKDPATMLTKVKALLKPDGCVLASVYNGMHYTVIHRLINGKELVEDHHGPLDQNNLRSLTQKDIQSLFGNAGLTALEQTSLSYAVNEKEEQWIRRLAQLSNRQEVHEYKVYQFLLKARSLNRNTELEVILSKIEVNDTALEESIQDLADLVAEGKVSHEDIVREANRFAFNKQIVYNQVAVAFFSQRLYDHVIPLLQAALEQDPLDSDTLYNLSYILHRLGANHEALRFLNRMGVRDRESNELKMRIEEHLRT